MDIFKNQAVQINIFLPSISSPVKIFHFPQTSPLTRKAGRQDKDTKDQGDGNSLSVPPAVPGPSLPHPHSYPATPRHQSPVYRNSASLFADHWKIGHRLIQQEHGSVGKH